MPHHFESHPIEPVPVSARGEICRSHYLSIDLAVLSLVAATWRGARNGK